MCVKWERAIDCYVVITIPLGWHQQAAVINNPIIRVGVDVGEEHTHFQDGVLQKQGVSVWVALYKKLQLLLSLPDNDNYLLQKKIKGLYKLRVLGNPDRIITTKLRLTRFHLAVNNKLRLKPYSSEAPQITSQTSVVVLQTINKTDAGIKSGWKAIVVVLCTHSYIDS